MVAPCNPFDESLLPLPDVSPELRYRADRMHKGRPAWAVRRPGPVLSSQYRRDGQPQMLVEGSLRMERMGTQPFQAEVVRRLNCPRPAGRRDNRDAEPPR